MKRFTNKELQKTYIKSYKNPELVYRYRKACENVGLSVLDFALTVKYVMISGDRTGQTWSDTDHDVRNLRELTLEELDIPWYSKLDDTKENAILCEVWDEEGDERFVRLIVDYEYYSAPYDHEKAFWDDGYTDWKYALPLDEKVVQKWL